MNHPHSKEGMKLWGLMEPSDLGDTGLMEPKMHCDPMGPRGTHCTLGKCGSKETMVWLPVYTKILY